VPLLGISQKRGKKAESSRVEKGGTENRVNEGAPSVQLSTLAATLQAQLELGRKSGREGQTLDGAGGAGRESKEGVCDGVEEAVYRTILATWGWYVLETSVRSKLSPCAI